jgi:hypothetical protein
MLVEFDVHHRLATPFRAVEVEATKAYSGVTWHAVEAFEEGL